MKALKFLSMAVAISIVSFTAVSCGDDDDPPVVIPETAYDKVTGQYTGTMTCTPEVAPTEGETPESETTAFEMKDKKVVFKAFPVESIVTEVAGEEDAPAIIEAIGDLAVEIGFTAEFNKEETEVTVKPAQKVVTFELPAPTQEPEGRAALNEGEGEEEEEPETIEYKVTLVADGDGKYVVEGKKFDFSLVVDKIEVDGVAMENFTKLTLDFTATKK